MRTNYRLSLAIFSVFILTVGKSDSSESPTVAIPATQAAEAASQKVIEMEKQWWEAYKNHDVSFYRDHLKSEMVFVNHSGRQTKADLVDSAGSSRCEVRGYSLSDFKTIILAKGVVLLSYHATEDTTCDGKKSASEVYGTTIYANEGSRWFITFAQETLVPE